jgi:hypothetical protein
MPNRFDLILCVSVLTNLSLLVVSILLLLQSAFRSKACWFLAYVLINLYSDYTLIVKRLDKMFEFGGSLLSHITLPTSIEVGFDLIAQIILLVLIWLFFGQSRQSLKGPDRSEASELLFT